jgi:ATP-dependent RNA helicase DDX51/DBP6
MFQVGRFDPRQEEREKRKTAAPSATKEKRKKKKRHDKKGTDDASDSQKEDHTNEETTLRLIAPETSGSSSTDKKLNTKLAEEAFDDLDITEELIQDNVKEDGEEPVDPTDEIKTALYMSKQPIHDAAAGWGLAPFLVENLKQDGYNNFFPIQSLVIPDVIAAERHAHIRARDICVAAPTGSGKTLAFVIPVLNALANRQIRRLRALVVLPSRDLGTCVT